MPSRKTAPQTEPRDWMSRIKESSHEVFLAGLASLARARGGEAGTPVSVDFEQLVAEGRELEPQMKESVQKAWQDWKVKSKSPLGSLRPDGKLQEVFEERVASVLARLGVPSRNEIEALSAKVDRLLASQRTAAAPRGRAPAKKAAAKKAARRTTER